MLLIDFIEKAFRRLPIITDTLDREAVYRCAGDLYQKGFTLDDAVEYLRNLEHVNPDIPEDVALRNMTRLMNKYESIGRKNDCY